MDTSSNAAIEAVREKVISNGYSCGTKAFIAKAKGSILTDVEGNEIIDFAGGIGVMNLGHSHPKVVAALKDQAEKFTHTCFMVSPYANAIELAERLTKVTPGNFAKKVVFVNSGAEAVENAVKIARAYTKRPAVIVFDRAYHGRTSLTMAMTAKVKPYKWNFGPYAPEVYRAPYGDMEALKNYFLTGIDPESVACMVIEGVQGEGGFMVPKDDNYFKELHAFCKENGIVFVVDEIQSGYGRTGKMYAIENWGVEPDLITTAKSIAVGMPLSAVVGRAEIMDSVQPGGLGGTYGANPMACAAALAVLDAYEEEHVLDQAVELGKKLTSTIERWCKEISIVGEMRGIGAMRGFSLQNADGTPAPDKVKALSAYSWERGLLLLNCGIKGDVIRMLMPLTIEDDVLQKGLGIIEAGLKELS